MRFNEIFFYIIIPSLSFYGVVYGNELSITLIEYYCYLMFFICFIVIYYVEFTQTGYEYIKKAKLSDNYGSTTYKFGYILMVSISCLFISYDYFMMAFLIILPVISNERIARKIINARDV